jgi:hypothetical protein
LIDGPEGKAFGLFGFADAPSPEAADEGDRQEFAAPAADTPIATEIATIHRPEHSKPGEYSTFAAECGSCIN